MRVEDLRAGFDRITGAVTSDVDPYEAVMRRAHHHRRRRFRRLGATVAAVAAMALAGPAALNAAGPDDPPRPDTPPSQFEGFPVRSSWTWRLINSPTRGNLANDQTLVQGVLREFAQTGDMSNGLDLVGTAPSVKVLFAHDFSDWRTVAVAYYTTSAAMLVTRTAHRGASAAELVVGSGISRGWVEPFTIIGQSVSQGDDWRAQSWLGLAPTGCTVDTSTDGMVQPDGTVHRTWQPSPDGDYVLSEAFPPAGLWRVTCDGIVRFQSSAAWQGAYDDGVAAPDQPKPTDVQAARGTVDPATAGTALAAYRGLTEHAGIPTGTAAVRWGGSVPGIDGKDMPAVLVGPESGAAPAVLQVGSATSFMVAVGPTPQPRPYHTPEPGHDAFADMSWTATASTGTSDLMAIRLPARKDLGVVPTDNLLILAPSATVEVEAVADGRQVWKANPLNNGAGIFDIRHRGDVTLRARDQNGVVLATAPLHDPADGDHLFGEKLINNW